MTSANISEDRLIQRNDIDHYFSLIEWFRQKSYTRIMVERHTRDLCTLAENQPYYPELMYIWEKARQAELPLLWYRMEELMVEVNKTDLPNMTNHLDHLALAERYKHSRSNSALRVQLFRYIGSCIDSCNYYPKLRNIEEFYRRYGKECDRIHEHLKKRLLELDDKEVPQITNYNELIDRFQYLRAVSATEPRLKLYQDQMYVLNTQQLSGIFDFTELKKRWEHCLESEVEKQIEKRMFELDKLCTYIPELEERIEFYIRFGLKEHYRHAHSRNNYLCHVGEK